MSKRTFHLVSLGCAKNSVDSDSMAQLLMDDGYELVENPKKAGVLIVNTCGFIGPAKEESVKVLKELAKQKRKNQLLIAAGCLTQRYGVEVARQVPGIDGILGTRRWMDILQVVNKLRATPQPEPFYHLPDAATVGADERGIIRASVAGASAYLKIADGCRRPCAFCAIPLIKGTAISRPIDTIVAEARELREMGIRELILIAQDTTDYGHDLGMKDGLAVLLEKLTDEVPEMDWIRVMYSFPGYVTDRLIDVMASRKQILPYLDIPLQHAHPNTLARMKRPANMEWVHTTLAKMRAAMPDPSTLPMVAGQRLSTLPLVTGQRLAIRTTFIVGYPGETEEEFQALINFVQEIRFDRVGAFKFSFEPGTTSEALGDPVPAAVKDERWERLMSVQQNISLQINQSYVGKTLDVLVEGYDNPNTPGAGGLTIGRSYRDAPEIDGLVFAEGKAEIGEMVKVKISGAMAYDLTGTLLQTPIKL